MDTRYFALPAVALMLSIGYCLPAHAQWYGKAQLGYSMSNSVDIKENNFSSSSFLYGDSNSTTPGKIDDVGNSPLLGGGLGWDSGKGFRVDAMLSYRGGYKIDQTMADTLRVQAKVKSLSLMINGYYDFDLAAVKPFIGLGVGLARNKVSDVTFGYPTLVGLTFGVPDATKTGLAWSLNAGASFPLSGKMVLEGALSYATLGKVTFAAGPTLLNGSPSSSDYVGAEGKLRVWEFSLALRF